MACSDYPTYWEFWTNGQPFEGIECVFTDQLGGAVTALLIFMPFAIALTIQSRTLVLPTVAGMLVGAVMITQLPAEAANLALMVIVIAGSVLLTTFITVQLRSPST